MVQTQQEREASGKATGTPWMQAAAARSAPRLLHLRFEMITVMFNKTINKPSIFPGETDPNLRPARVCPQLTWAAWAALRRWPMGSIALWQAGGSIFSGVNKAK